MKSVEDIADKMERVVRVIYMATDHLSYRNEIRNNIRSSSLSVMAGVIDVVSNNGYDSQRDLQASLYKTMSYIKIAMSDKSMSDNNGQLLLSAYKRLLSFINNIILTDSINVTDSIKDIQFTATIDHSLIDTAPNILSSREKKYLDINSKSKPNLNNKSERREKILNIIKSKSINNLDIGLNIGCSMSDLLSDLKDMNEKMIQRELISMVIDQLIVKKGEKRWSRYVAV